MYEELLGRVFHILGENNPKLARDRRRTVMRPPQVLREGTKKTVFANFMDLCRTNNLQKKRVVYASIKKLKRIGKSREEKEDEEFVKMMREAEPYFQAHRGSTFVVILSSEVMENDYMGPILEGGIFNGEIINIGVAFKPISTIGKNFLFEAKGQIFR